MAQIVCLWSGPRNVSTAVMYAFAQRADTEVLDEPLYGHYLRVTGANHPGDAEVMAQMNCDAAAVVEQILAPAFQSSILFCKMMAHHLVDVPDRIVAKTKPVILTRAPKEVLATLVHQIPQPELRDTGYDKQVALLERFPNLPVIDAELLLRNPEGVLQSVCHKLGIGFDANMLSWPAGPKPYDGVWAPYWYHNVHKSTGFAPYRPKDSKPPEHVNELLAVCQPLYDRLRAQAITGEDLCK